MLVIPAGASGPANLNPPGGSAGTHVSAAVSPRLSSRWATTVAWSAGALLLIAIFGALKLAVPLHRDTANFLWVATQLDHGAVLYVDVWDVKQPGMFLFAWLAGRLFGFTPQGLHLLELAWHLTFAVAAIAALRPLLRHPWIAAVAPAAFLIPYYVYAEPHQQMQLEVLVALPLFVTAWLSSIDWRSEGSRATGFFAAGIAAGVATAFKHVLAPIPVAFVVAASIAVLRGSHERSGSPLARRWRLLLQFTWMPFAAGVILVWGGIALAFWRLGALDEFLFTTFLYPVEALGAVARAPVGRLALALSVFVVAMAPWLFYAGWALFWHVWRGGPALFGRMLVWLAMAMIVILMQKSSWWAYHMLLLYAPAGVLAARGLDLILERLTAAGAGAGAGDGVTAGAFPGAARGSRSPGAVAISALLVLPVVAASSYPAAETARVLVDGLTGPSGNLETYRRLVSTDYAGAAEATAFLSSHAPAGPIYVFGDPTILQLSGRRSALPEQGSAWDFYLPEQWRRLPDDLRVAAPVWVFAEEHSLPGIEEKSPGTAALLHDDYRVVWSTPYGRWFERRVPQSGEPGDR